MTSKPNTLESPARWTTRSLRAAWFAIVLTACLLPARFASADDASPAIERKREIGVMGTSLVITVFGDDAAKLEAAIDAAIAEIRRVEDVMTDWRPSELMRVNEHAGKGPWRAPEEVVRLIARGLEISEITGGAFDMTFASAGKLWSFKESPEALPSPSDVEAALRHVDWKRVEADLEANTVAMPEGFRIGLGGIAKGYGVDRAMDVLRRHGIEHAMVNAGGDLKALGLKRGKTWQIAIKHPRDRERVVAVLPVSNTCVVTSGDYERFFELNGRRYHHILDPRTGYPSTGCMSATVVAPDAAVADALATALCVLGPEEGLALVERIPRVEAIAIGMDGEVRVSSGLASHARDGSGR